MRVAVAWSRAKPEFFLNRLSSKLLVEVLTSAVNCGLEIAPCLVKI